MIYAGAGDRVLAPVPACKTDKGGGAMTDKEKRLTIWYEEMDGNDYPLVGKKNANLGEMIKAGIPVAPGFAITIHANDKFIIEMGIKEQLAKKLPELGEVTYETAREASNFAIKLIEEATLPSDLEEAILSDYRKLCDRYPGSVCPVAVRRAVPCRCPARWRHTSTSAGKRT